MEKYYSWSRQKINVKKSNVHFSMNRIGAKVRELANILGFHPLWGNSKYLVLPFIFSKRKSSYLNSVIQRVESMLASWKGHCLSQAGRGVFAKSVAMAIPAYALSVIPLQKHLCNKIDTTIRNFWWGANDDKNKLVLKSWISIHRSKDLGALGFRSMENINKIFLSK